MTATDIFINCYDVSRQAKVLQKSPHAFASPRPTSNHYQVDLTLNRLGLEFTTAQLLRIATMDPTATAHTDPMAVWECTSSDAVVLTEGGDDVDGPKDGTILQAAPCSSLGTRPNEHNGQLDAPICSDNAARALDRNTMMLEAEIHALRTHVCQIQSTLMSTTSDLVQQGIALWQLQSDNKGLHDRLSVLTEKPGKPGPVNLEDEVEIGILRPSVEGLEKERAETEAVITVLKKQREDTNNQLSHAGAVIDRQDQEMRRLAVVITRKDEQIDHFAASFSRDDHYARQQADRIKALKRQLSRFVSRPRRRRPNSERLVREAYIPHDLGQRARSKDESPRRSAIPRRPSVKRRRAFGRIPSV